MVMVAERGRRARPCGSFIFSPHIVIWMYHHSMCSTDVFEYRRYRDPKGKPQDEVDIPTLPALHSLL